MKNRIEDFKLQPLENPAFISTSLATFRHNGIERSWEVLQSHDSVAILLYHRERDAFVLVEQFRPAVYLNNNKGMTLELCAGIVDKSCSLVQIAKEEIEEECGYRVALEEIEKISSFHSSVGVAGSRQTLYYAEVDESMKVSEGGGVDDEQIEVVYLPISKSKALMYDESIAKTTGVMFAFMWWYEKRREAESPED